MLRLVLFTLATTEAWRVPTASHCSHSVALGPKRVSKSARVLTAVRMEAADDDLMAALWKKLEDDSDEQDASAVDKGATTQPTAPAPEAAAPPMV